MRLTVAKVGGSLFDLPDLGNMLNNWVASRPAPVLFVPGGGAGADVIRQLDRLHGLGEERSHWLALRILTTNAHFLGALLGVDVVESATLVGAVAVVDPFLFCQADEGRTGALPHHWGVSSDAIAARITEVASADLVLLKSANLPPDTSWADASQEGLIDEMFESIVARSNIPVTWVNLRRPDAPRR